MKTELKNGSKIVNIIVNVILKKEWIKSTLSVKTECSRSYDLSAAGGKEYLKASDYFLNPKRSIKVRYPSMFVFFKYSSNPLL